MFIESQIDRFSADVAIFKFVIVEIQDSIDLA